MLERGPYNDVYEKLEELENALFDNAFNATTLRGEVASGSVLRVLETDGLVVAYSIVRRVSHLHDVIRLGVREGYQGQGLGSRLLQTAIAAGGAADVMLTVRKANVGALRLYRRFGFRITGELENSWVMLTSSADRIPAHTSSTS